MGTHKNETDGGSVTKKPESARKGLTGHPLKRLQMMVLSLLVLLGSDYALAGGPSAGDRIVVEKITIGQDIIAPGSRQLIEVLIKNYSSVNQPLVVKLVITLPNQLIITFGEKEALAKAKTDTRVLLVYPLDPKKAGEYTVAAKLFEPGGNLITATTENQDQHFFAGDPAKRKIVLTRQKTPETKSNLDQPAATVKAETVALKFDPPDLGFEKIELSNNNSVLRGETAHVRLVLTNIGGDIAENVSFQAFWYFEHRPRRKVKFFEDKMGIIAPGERKIIEIPVTIPELELKGRYWVQAVIDTQNIAKESNEENNTSQSEVPLIFSDIALEFPEESHSFAEDGRFLFQWRSKLYNQFKVQISADEQFLDLEKVFELPKGDKWESAQMIRPLAGELPVMAVSLMEDNNLDHLFWRVKARNSQGETTESAARKFYISLKPEPQCVGGVLGEGCSRYRLAMI